jgi:hypothetical protein
MSTNGVTLIRSGPLGAVSPSERPPALPAHVAAALATLAGYMASLCKQPAPTETADGGRYYDARTSPLGRRAFLRLAREGAFPTFRAGKKLLARRSDVHAWIEAQEGARAREPAETGPKPLPTDPTALHELLMSKPVTGRARAAGRRGA